MPARVIDLSLLTLNDSCPLLFTVRSPPLIVASPATTRSPPNELGPVPSAENEPYVVKSHEELLNVNLGVVPSVPNILIEPPLRVRFPVAVSIWKVVLSGIPVAPPLVIVKN